jgi:hypothetical protein
LYGTAEIGGDMGFGTVFRLPTPPFITTQPHNQTLPIGGTACFAVSAIGSPSLAYQWYFNNAPLATGTNAILTLGPLLTNQAGNYKLVVTNLYGSATSAVAGLTVWLCPNVYGIAAGADGGGSITLNLASIPGSTNRLWASTNLTFWEVIATNAAGADGLFQLTDTNTTLKKMQFYRISTP